MSATQTAGREGRVASGDATLPGLAALLLALLVVLVLAVVASIVLGSKAIPLGDVVQVLTGHGDGVADRKMVCPARSTHSSNRSGRLSAADGRRKPWSTSVSFRDRSLSYWPCSWGIVTWLASMIVR